MNTICNTREHIRSSIVDTYTYTHANKCVPSEEEEEEEGAVSDVCVSLRVQHDYTLILPM
jgi:hypothetical protein